MGIGCRRDPLEANVWYVRAADQGDTRAQNRLETIRSAETGSGPVQGTGTRKGAKKAKPSLKPEDVPNGGKKTLSKNKSGILRDKSDGEGAKDKDKDCVIM